jgi:hypothetical protein
VQHKPWKVRYWKLGVGEAWGYFDSKGEAHEFGTSRNEYGYTVTLFGEGAEWRINEAGSLRRTPGPVIRRDRLVDSVAALVSSTGKFPPISTSTLP